MTTTSIVLLFNLLVLTAAVRETNFKFMFGSLTFYGIAEEYVDKSTTRVKIVIIELMNNKEDRDFYPKLTDGTIDLSTKTMAEKCLSYRRRSTTLEIFKAADVRQTFGKGYESVTWETKNVIGVQLSEDRKTLDITYITAPQYCQFLITLTNHDYYIGSAMAVTDTDETYLVIIKVLHVKKEVSENVTLSPLHCANLFQLWITKPSAMTAISSTIPDCLSCNTEWVPIRIRKFFEFSKSYNIVYTQMKKMEVSCLVVSGSQPNVKETTVDATVYKDTTEDKIAVLDSHHGLYKEFTMHFNSQLGDPSEHMQLQIGGLWWPVKRKEKIKLLGSNTPFRAAIEYCILKTTLGGIEYFGYVRKCTPKGSGNEVGKSLEIQVVNGKFYLATDKNLLGDKFPLCADGSDWVGKLRDSAIALSSTANAINSHFLSWRSIYIRKSEPSLEGTKAIFTYVEPKEVEVTVLEVTDVNGQVENRKTNRELKAKIKKYLTVADNQPELDTAWTGDLILEWTVIIEAYANSSNVTGEDAPVHLFVRSESNPEKLRRFIGKREFLGSRLQILGHVVMDKVTFWIHGSPTLVVEATIDELNRRITISDCSNWRKFKPKASTLPTLKSNSEWEKRLENHKKETFSFTRATDILKSELEWIKIVIDSPNSVLSGQCKKTKEKNEATVLSYYYALRRMV